MMDGWKSGWMKRWMDEKMDDFSVSAPRSDK